MTGGNITYMKAVENEIVAGRSLIAQDYKDVASVILLDQELANSLFGSAQEAVNQVIDVGGFSYRVIGVYTSDEAKTAKTLVLVDFRLRLIFLLPTTSIWMRFLILSSVSMIPV